MREGPSERGAGRTVLRDGATALGDEARGAGVTRVGCDEACGAGAALGAGVGAGETRGADGWGRAAVAGVLARGAGASRV